MASELPSRRNVGLRLYVNCLTVSASPRDAKVDAAE